MESSSAKTIELQPDARNNLRVSSWFVFFVIWTAAMVVWAWYVATNANFHWPDSFSQLPKTFSTAPSLLKLIVFGVYISFCCTFFPLPTSGIVAAVAAQETAVATGLWNTVLLVSLVGAIGSTIANLNDYHVMTLLLRSKQIAKIRDTKTYEITAKWFNRSPFFLLVIFNVLPVPIDIVRMLAVTDRYNRTLFAVSNFIGRFIRYAVIAFVTYYWNLGWTAIGGLFGFAFLLVMIKAIPKLFQGRFNS